MGKRYYCEYCHKMMVASPSIVRTHNNGLVHQKIVSRHYQQFKDIETILSEESRKKPCIRFAAGTCNFDALCRNSHYSREQMQEFREYVAAKRSSTSASQPSFEELYKKLQDKKSTKSEQQGDHTVILDPNGITHILPWTYKGDSDSKNLTPSLRGLQFKDFEDLHLVQWGSIN